MDAQPTAVTPPPSTSEPADEQHTKSLKRPIEAVGDSEATPSPQELELARLQKIYEDAQVERRTLLRQIQEMLDAQSAPSPSRAVPPSEDEDEDEDDEDEDDDGEAGGEQEEETASVEPKPGTEGKMESPSTGAHSSLVPQLTTTEETEISGRAQGVIKDHIKLLSKYNEIRDIGQGLIGMVAESRRARIRDCQEEFGVTDGD
jgi:hypothetical protein